jgi:hypothetical protein
MILVILHDDSYCLRVLFIIIIIIIIIINEIGEKAKKSSHTYIHSCMHTYIHTYIHTYMHTSSSSSSSSHHTRHTHPYIARVHCVSFITCRYVTVMTAESLSILYGSGTTASIDWANRPTESPISRGCLAVLSAHPRDHTH